MKRTSLIAALLVSAAAAGVAHAEPGERASAANSRSVQTAVSQEDKSGRVRDFVANPALPAELSSVAAAEVRRHLPAADLSGLTTADVGAIGAVLAGDDAGKAAQLRSIIN